MKVKTAFIALLSLLTLISISQIFSIPPYARDVFPVYKSGYFDELEKGFGIIADSFIAIKSMARPEYAWIFLSDLRLSRDIQVKVYDSRGYLVPAPGERAGKPDEEVVRAMDSMSPGIRSEIRGSRYVTLLPLFVRGECRFCHARTNRRGVIGALRFERGFNAAVYYTSERIMIFIIITAVLVVLLYAVVRWDPGRSIKELFDK
jgi:hypothetical protein